jgi:aryl-alcohol dehydrogenase-like predicted oxidoreductase
MNLFAAAPEMVSLCETQNLASVIRSPLAMGMLSGKFTGETRLSKDDVRGAGHDWVKYFRDGKPDPVFLKMLESVREILKSGGRTLAQGALAYLWGRSDTLVPIPGFKTVRQAEENAKAMEFGPLNPTQMKEIDSMLAAAKA